MPPAIFDGISLFLHGYACKKKEKTVSGFLFEGIILSVVGTKGRRGRGFPLPIGDVVDGDDQSYVEGKVMAVV